MVEDVLIDIKVQVYKNIIDHRCRIMFITILVEHVYMTLFLDQCWLIGLSLLYVWLCVSFSSLIQNTGLVADG